MRSLLSLADLNRFSTSSHRRCSVKKVFLKITDISHQTTCVGVFCNKVTQVAHNIFLWNLRNFQEHLYSKASISDCFWFSESSIWFIFNINRVQSRYFFKGNNPIWSNAAISIKYNLKNVSLFDSSWK